MRLFYVFRRSSGLPLWFRDFQESMAGSGGNTPACMYLGLDSALLHEDLLDLLDRVQKPDSLEVYWAVQSGALFAFASGHEDSCEEIIALYDERAKADHMLDFSGNLTGIMQRLVKTQEELRGDLLLSFMAARAAGLIKFGSGRSELISSRPWKRSGTRRARALVAAQRPVRFQTEPGRFTVRWASAALHRSRLRTAGSGLRLLTAEQSGYDGRADSHKGGS